MSWLKRGLSRGVGGLGPRGIAICVALAAGVYAASLGYELLNHGPYVLFLRTPLDRAMPLVPVFAVPYVTLQPAIYLTLVVFLLFRAGDFRALAISIIAAFLVSYVFYALLQTYIERPVVTGSDVFSRMVRDVYAGDQPYNDFPSLHVSLSTLLAIHWMRVDRRAGVAAAVWAVLVIAATQLIHQHYLADVAGGLAVAFGTSWVGRSLAERIGGT